MINAGARPESSGTALHDPVIEKTNIGFGPESKNRLPEAVDPSAADAEAAPG